MDDMSRGPVGTVHRPSFLVDGGQGGAVGRVHDDGVWSRIFGAPKIRGLRLERLLAGALRRVARPHGVLLALAAITVLGEIALLFFPARQAGAEEA